METRKPTIGETFNPSNFQRFLDNYFSYTKIGIGHLKGIKEKLLDQKIIHWGNNNDSNNLSFYCLGYEVLVKLEIKVLDGSIDFNMPLMNTYLIIDEKPILILSYYYNENEFVRSLLPKKRYPDFNSADFYKYFFMFMIVEILEYLEKNSLNYSLWINERIMIKNSKKE